MKTPKPRSIYERTSLREARAAFSNPLLTPLSALAHLALEARQEGKQDALGLPAKRLSRGLSTALALLHALALKTLSSARVIDAYGKAGYRRVKAPADVQKLDLWEVDEVAESLRGKYLLAAAGSGLVAGSFGLVGATTDLPLLAAMALRCLDECALFYGFDPSLPSERRFIVKVLAAAIGPAASAKTASVDEIVQVALTVKKHWETRRFGGISLPMAAQLLRRGAQMISGKKRSRVLGTLGAAATGGVNTWLMMGVLQAGMSAYREKFLLRGLGTKKKRPRTTSVPPAAPGTDISAAATSTVGAAAAAKASASATAGSDGSGRAGVAGGTGRRRPRQRRHQRWQRRWRRQERKAGEGRSRHSLTSAACATRGPSPSSTAVRSSSDLMAAMDRGGEAFLLCRDATTLQVVALVEGSQVTFGRGEEADVRTESPRVSRLHARFSLEGGLIEVHDLASRNGTRVNGTMVRDARAKLEGGDIVDLGPVEVVVARAAHAMRAAVVDPSSIPSSAERDEAIGEGIIVADGSMVKLFAVVRRLAAVTSPVLITGETGVGKEVVAEHVHKWSLREGGPFVRLNCGAVPPDLLESELFGHERDAFAGAARRRTGYFEAAQRGTLLLDEIDAVPLALQAKLLRVLETRTLTLVGGTTEIPLDVRILCATHRDLRRAVTEGGFRQDFYYRLSTFTLEVPPLRERPTELVLLAELFARRFARELGRRTPNLTPAARSLLGSHRWPGNVRELRNVMEHSIVMHDSMTLDAEDIADLSPQKRAAVPRERPNFLRLSTPAIPPLRDQMHDVEREVIRAALKAEGGNRTRAAKRLEMSRRGLIYKMIKYGLRD